MNVYNTRMLTRECLKPRHFSTGLPEVKVPRGIHKTDALINKSLEIFGFILADDDFRWQVVDAALEVKKVQHTGIHKEAALQAIYLSDEPSYRNKYGDFYSPPNMLQLCRAIINISQFPHVQTAFAQLTANPQTAHALSFMAKAPGLNLQFQRTNRVELGVNEYNVTGCPEALYQLQAFWKKWYIGRIGFNCHYEANTLVISISNIQGIPGGKEIYKWVRNRTDSNIFNLLVKTLVALSPNLLQPGDQLAIRGLANPKKGNPAMYQHVLTAQGVPLFNRHISVTEAQAQSNLTE